jgi:RPA family protein
MEGAARVFAGEYNGSTLSILDDDPGNPAWVVTPGGAWCRSLFLSGALTEVSASGDMVHSRMADPTGAFDLVIGGRNTPLAETFCKIPVPSFVTVSGRAQMYVKNGIVNLSVRPDHIRIVNRLVRDQWVLVTAKSTLGRLNLINLAMQGSSADTRIPGVIRHYSITRARLQELARMVEGAVQTVHAPVCEISVPPDIRMMVMEFMAAGNGPRGIAVEEIIRKATESGASREAVLSAIESLITDDECYQPQKGFVKPL